MLGLATGSSPTQVYKWLVRWHKEGALSFKNVTTFNLVGLQYLNHIMALPCSMPIYHHLCSRSFSFSLRWRRGVCGMWAAPLQIHAMHCRTSIVACSQTTCKATTIS